MVEKKKEIKVPKLILHINAFQVIHQLHYHHGITYKHIILYLVPLKKGLPEKKRWRSGLDEITTIISV